MSLIKQRLTLAFAWARVLSKFLTKLLQRSIQAFERSTTQRAANVLQIKVTALKGELETHLRQAWTEYKRQRISNTNDELLGLLARIETFKPTVQIIQRLVNQLKVVDFLKDAQQFEQIDQSIDHLLIA